MRDSRPKPPRASCLGRTAATTSESATDRDRLQRDALTSAQIRVPMFGRVSEFGAAVGDPTLYSLARCDDHMRKLEAHCIGRTTLSCPGAGTARRPPVVLHMSGVAPDKPSASCLARRIPHGRPMPADGAHGMQREAPQGCAPNYLPNAAPGRPQHQRSPTIYLPLPQVLLQLACCSRPADFELCSLRALLQGDLWKTIP